MLHDENQHYQIIVSKRKDIRRSVVLSLTDPLLLLHSSLNLTALHSEPAVITQTGRRHAHTFFAHLVEETL